MTKEMYENIIKLLTQEKNKLTQENNKLKRQLEQYENGEYDTKDFELFRASYPNKKSKGDARKKYETIVKTKLATPKQLLQGAEAYTRETAHIEKNFIKHPATRLNQECREDEIEADREPTVKELFDVCMKGNMNRAAIRRHYGLEKGNELINKHWDVVIEMIHKTPEWNAY